MQRRGPRPQWTLPPSPTSANSIPLTSNILLCPQAPVAPQPQRGTGAGGRGFESRANQQRPGESQAPTAPLRAPHFCTDRSKFYYYTRKGGKNLDLASPNTGETAAKLRASRSDCPSPSSSRATSSSPGPSSARRRDSLGSPCTACASACGCKTEVRPACKQCKKLLKTRR